MGEFFKPWRRKIGVMTLVMACGLSLAWVSSEIVNDCVYFGPTYGILSDRGRIHWWQVNDGILPPNQKAHLWINSEGYWVSGGGPDFELKPAWTVSYWLIVIPPTLLSACLLLSKPRVAKPVQK